MNKNTPGTGGKTKVLPKGKADDPQEAVRLEVIRLLRGPVAQCFTALIPELAATEDPYKAAISNFELLGRCFKTFHARRDAFASFLVNAHGDPVTDDSVRLACGRSVNEMTGMAVRSAMRAYAEQYFSGNAPKAPSTAAMTVAEKQRAGWISAVTDMFGRRQVDANGVKPMREGTTRFYGAIREALDFAWQLQFFPVYVEIPAELFEKLGTGLTRLDTVDKLQRLAQLDSDDIAKAEQIIGDADLAKDMLRHNVLAAESVSQMDPEQFNTVNGALAHLDARKKWDIFANTLTALALGADKRISKADIAVLADYLHLLNVHAVRVIFDLQLGREQIAEFLAIATKALGSDLFIAVFGPLPFFGIGEEATLNQKRYSSFVETTLKSLVSAIKQLTAKFKRDAPEFISECLKLVCEARRDGIAAEILKLAPSG